jgi:hypothetical protein
VLGLLGYQVAFQGGGRLRSIHRRMARISIEPRWARYYDFGAGRVPAFLAELGQEWRRAVVGS